MEPVKRAGMLKVNARLESGADPELLLGGGANPWGAPTQYFNNIFSKTL